MRGLSEINSEQANLVLASDLIYPWHVREEGAHCERCGSLSSGLHSASTLSPCETLFTYIPNPTLVYNEYTTIGCLR